MQSTSALHLLVTLTVAPGEERAFRAYERHALAILRRHGGELLHALRPEPEADGTVRELHLLRLPSHRALDAYRNDPALLPLQEMRATAIVDTTVIEVDDVSGRYATPAVTVRPGAHADARPIAEVHAASWRTTYRGIVPDPYLDALDPEREVPSLEQRIASPAPNTVTLVAEVEGEGVVGYALGGPGRNEAEGVGEIYAIYLLDEWEGRGIGGRLMREGAANLAALGMDRLVVWVLAQNRSCGFYERLGGRATREQEIRIGGAALTVVAYEWDDLRTLVEA